MAKTLLIADPKWTWREWLKENLGSRDFVCLDVSDADHGPAARVFFMQKGKVRKWRLVGTVASMRNPVDLLAGAYDMLGSCSDDAVVLSFEIRRTPVLRQMGLALAETIGVSEVVVPEGSELIGEPWVVAPWAVDLGEELPETAMVAQRRSRWLEMLEGCDEHEISLDDVGLYGARLGSGERLKGSPFDELGEHVEVCGSVLHVVSDKEPDESLVGDAMNLSHATRLNIVSADEYNGLICSFVREVGEDFGIGVIKSIDFKSRKAVFLNNAVAPAPVKTVRIGAVRIDEKGKETGEVKPWTV